MSPVTETVSFMHAFPNTVILLRHQEWERHVRRKQVNMRTALDTKLAQLQSASGIQDLCALSVNKRIHIATMFLQSSDMLTVRLALVPVLKLL